MKENASETWGDVEEKVQRVLQDKLQVEGVQIERAHRTGRRNEGRPRTIVMKLLSYKDKERILKLAKNLKGTSIYINEDFSPATMKIRKDLFKEIKRRREKGERVGIKYDRIVKLKPVSSSYNGENTK